jgi:hypothetical protein
MFFNFLEYLLRKISEPESVVKELTFGFKSRTGYCNLSELSPEHLLLFSLV